MRFIYFFGKISHILSKGYAILYLQFEGSVVEINQLAKYCIWIGQSSRQKCIYITYTLLQIRDKSVNNAILPCFGLEQHQFNPINNLSRIKENFLYNWKNEIFHQMTLHQYEVILDSIE